MLVSPEFLFRAIRTPADVRTASIPADRPGAGLAPVVLPVESGARTRRCSQIAAAGKLRAPDVLRAQALRMLTDRRASSLVRNFALKALDLDKLGEVVPDPNLFPTFDERLRRDMAAEIESFVASVLLEDRNVGDLLTADHTFLNERLARHYGITSVLGPQFRRVTLDDSRRWGLLGKGRRAAADLVRRSHVAGSARRVGARQADGNAADAAAARRRHRSVDTQRRSCPRRCARGSKVIARSPAATSATA